MGRKPLPSRPNRLDRSPMSRSSRVLKAWRPLVTSRAVAVVAGGVASSLDPRAAVETPLMKALSRDACLSSANRRTGCFAWSFIGLTHPRWT